MYDSVSHTRLPARRDGRLLEGGRYVAPIRFAR
jgi:hypothetical protein